MGTVAELKVVAAAGVDPSEALEAALAELERIEALTTVHSDSSEVSRLEREGELMLSPAVANCLALACSVATLSKGAFDPTAGALVRLWGFPDAPALPDSAAVDRARARVDPARIRLGIGRSARIVSVEPGTELDLGGVAKGVGVDRAAKILVDRVGPCLVNVGGDLVVHGTKPGGQPWRVGIQDPRDPSRLFTTLSLTGPRAVATSGDYQRYFEVDGVRYHHILDPRTGWPARGVRSATVVASTCALADAAATAAFVLGPEEGLAFLEGSKSLEGVLVTTDGSGELVLHETSGFAALRTP